MRVFVAGGTGVMGRRLALRLVARGHQVTATTTSAAKLGLLRQLGADAVVMDSLGAVSVGEAVAAARPDAIVHQMTAINPTHAGKPDFKHMDRWFATTNRLRTEGTDHLLAAAEATGVSHVVAQSYANWNGLRKGGWVKTEEDPLDLYRGTTAHAVMDAIRHVEDVVVKAGGGQCERGQGRGPGDLAALECLPDTTHVDQGLPLGRGHPYLDRCPAVGPPPAGGIHRAVVPRAAADRPLLG